MRRIVWTAVLTRKVPQELNVEEFANAATKIYNSIKTHLCLNVDIDKFTSKLRLDESFKQLKPIPGIKRFHSLDPTNGDNLHCRLY